MAGGSLRHSARGPIELDPADPSGTTITDPTLLVEVLSPSTEEVDRNTVLRSAIRAMRAAGAKTAKTPAKRRAS